MGSSDLNFSKRRRGSRSSENNDSTRKDLEMKFQMHGQKGRPTATYTKVLEHVIVKIQSALDKPINIVKSILEKHRFAPVEPKWIRIKLEGTDEDKGDQVFRQETCNINYRENRKKYNQVNERFEED